MSNPNPEIAAPARVNEQAAMQTSAASPFDALQLHREGASMRTESNITPAVYHPGEANTLIAQAGPRVEEVRYPEHGRESGRAPGSTGALARGLLYDTLVAPYNNYPGYPAYGQQLTCVPSRYYGAPPVCYETPVIPFYGRDRFYVEPRHYAPRGQEHWRNGR
jgi:hypothetical protein